MQVWRTIKFDVVIKKTFKIVFPRMQNDMETAQNYIYFSVSDRAGFF